MTSKRDAALELARAGFDVFPLAINGKTPAITGDWQKVATKDPARIDRLWRDPVFGDELDYNIGIRIPADLLVVDVDVRQGKRGRKSLDLLEAIYGDLPPTMVITTASGGEHRYYRVPDSRGAAKELAEHIDLKGAGGYVVGAGSEIDGVFYRPHAAGDGDAIAGAPKWLCDHATARRRGARDRMEGRRYGPPIADLDTAAAIERAIDWLKAAPDHGTYAVAARVKDFGISQEKCTELMLEHWRDAREIDKDDDHIEFRVANAYHYGRNAPGVANPEAEFEAMETAGDSPAIQPKRRGLYAVAWADARPELTQNHLIKGLIDRGAMVVTYGDSNVGKTYVVLDQAIAVAAGVSWNKRPTVAGLVVYVIAEGGQGFMRRVAAYKRDRGIAELPFAIVPCAVDLFARDSLQDTAHLIRLIREQEARFGQKCTLVVVDTLARAMGAGDENTAADMGAFVINCDRIRAATGAAINLVHHTGKDASKGARGSSALRAATDTEIEVTRGRLIIQKQRDMEIGAGMAFTLRAVEIGQQADGERVTACVVEWIEESEFEVRLSPDAAAMFERFEELITAATEMAEEGGKEAGGVTWADWKMSALSGFEAAKGKPISEEYLYRLRKELLTSGVIQRGKRNQWVRGITNHPNHGLTTTN